MATHCLSYSLPTRRIFSVPLKPLAPKAGLRRFSWLKYMLPFLPVCAQAVEAVSEPSRCWVQQVEVVAAPGLSLAPKVKEAIIALASLPVPGFLEPAEVQAQLRKAVKR